VPGVAKHYASLAPKEQPTAVSVATKQPDAGANAVTDDEFLKSTGATAAPVSRDAGKPQKAPDAPSDDDFLKATGAAPAAPQTPETSQVPKGPSLADIITSPEAQAADRPAGFTPPSVADIRNALQPAPNTEYGNLPLSWVAKDTQTGDVRFAMPNALRAPLLELFGGGEGGPGMTTTMDPATGQMKSELSPLAGLLMGGVVRGPRDLQFGGGNPLARVPPGTFDTKAAVPGPITLERVNQAVVNASPETWRPVGPAEEFQPGREYRMNQATGQREVKEGGPVGGQTPPSSGAPQGETPAQSGAGTQPAGAQVTTAPIPEKTPAQRVADLEKTVTQTAEERAGPQMRDETPYVKDIPPRLLAAREFRPQHSLDEKTAKAQDTAFRAEVEKNTKDRNEGMVDLLRKDAGDANTLDAAHEARSQVSPAELGVFENEQPTSVAGIVSKIDKLLAGPEGKQKAVRNTLKDVRDSLHDADGNMETMPSQIYGSRKNLTDLLKRGAKGMGDVADDVRASKHVLESLLPDFDEAITKGAGRFEEYLQQWAEKSKSIDQQEFLQQYVTGPKKVTDKDGYLIPTKVQKMLDDILQGHKAKGVNKAKSLTDEQIANIEAVRNELAAQSLQDRLAAVKGSDTFQQLSRAAEKGTGKLGTGLKILGELGIGIPTAGVANIVLHHGVLPHLARRQAARAAEGIAARKQELLSPPNALKQP